MACTPASGWEKGQVENQVGLVRERFFTPRLRFKTLDALNAWLVDRCKDWALPPAIERVRRRLAGHTDGDRQMVGILTAITSDGVDAVEAACAEALAGGPVSSDVIINILTRQRQPPAPLNIVTPDVLRLRHEPRADCARYDSLRRPYGTPPDPGDDGRAEARRHASRL
jgi:hypothetical protein